MQRLSIFLIALSFCLLTASNALADELQTDNLGRNTPWSSWFDNEGNRISETHGLISSGLGKAQQILTRTNEGTLEFDWLRETSNYGSIDSGAGKAQQAMTGANEGALEFDWLRETDSYEYGKDQG